MYFLTLYFSYFSFSFQVEVNAAILGKKFSNFNFWLALLVTKKLNPTLFFYVLCSCKKRISSITISLHNVINASFRKLEKKKIQDWFKWDVLLYNCLTKSTRHWTCVLRAFASSEVTYINLRQDTVELTAYMEYSHKYTVINAKQGQSKGVITEDVKN